jgi:hypothetical protein
MVLPTLRLRAADGPFPHDPRREVVMTDPDGVPVAYGWTEGQDHWLQVPEIGTFHFFPGSQHVTATPAPEASVPSVEHAFRSVALPLVLHTSGFEALHGSAVTAAGGVVAFCALSGTGKSTLAYGLSQRGYSLWGDDAVVFEARPEHGIVAHAIPFTPGLREEALAVFDPGNGSAAPLAAPGSRQELRAVLLLERTNGGNADVEIVRLSAGDALAALVPHAHGFNLGDYARKRRTVQTYLALAAQVPVIEVGFLAGFERFPRVLDEVESAIAGL